MIFICGKDGVGKGVSPEDLHTIDVTVGLQNRCYLEIRIDGSITRRARLPFTGNGEDHATVSTSPVLAVGDTVVVQFYHASGAARSVTATLDMQRITY